MVSHGSSVLSRRVNETQSWKLGISSVGFREETRRFYPNGTNAAHVLGAVNIDNAGIAGIEYWIDHQSLQDLKDIGIQFDQEELEPVVLTIDLRVQHALEDELKRAIGKFKAIAGAGIVMDATNGEVLALASLPDFDSNSSVDALKPDNINRINVGVLNKALHSRR